MVSKSIVVWLMALLVALLNLSGALAKVDCNCHIGVKYSSTKVIDYGKIDSYPRLMSGKQGKCSDSCASKCATDIQDGNKVCRAIGIEFDNSAKNLGCFSVVGKSDPKNKKWDFDGKATFDRCERSCTCSEGSYDKARSSCVVNTGTVIPGLPDGDLRDGFFMLGGTMYKDVGGAICTVRAV